MHTRLLLIVSILFLTACPAWSAAYQYLSAEQVKQLLEKSAELTLVDIQVKEEFNRHHIAGSLATYAYPVKSDPDRQKLNSALTQAQSCAGPVVIICPRGKGGAKRAYDYLQTQGVAAKRLFILEEGQAGWPYPELLAKN